MLILFDIDATLIKTAGAGKYAMEDAARQLFGETMSIEGIEFGGSLDPLIMSQILERNGVAATAERMRAYRERYRELLGERLAVPGTGYSLPGVTTLIDRLDGREETTLGLLTGNFEETGEAKLRACGLDPTRFIVRVWGDDSPHSPPQRHHLPPIAFERYEKRHGRSVAPTRVVIIGDTPNDVHCARTNGCWVIGVATGQFSAETLRTSGAHHVVPDLQATDAIVGWIDERRSA